MSTATPSHIRADKEQRSNHFVREIRQTELFPDKDLAVGDVNIIPALSVAYYPTEKVPTTLRPMSTGTVNCVIRRNGGEE